MKLYPGGLSFSSHHQSGVQHNAREPGGESRPALETAQVTICRHECVLHRVFGVFLTLQYGVGQPDKSLARLQEYRLDRLPLSNVRLKLCESARPATARNVRGWPHVLVDTPVKVGPSVGCNCTSAVTRVCGTI